MEKEMMGMRGMKKSVVYSVLVVLMCMVIIVSVSATSVNFGKSNLVFSQKGPVSQNSPGNQGNEDTVKMGFSLPNSTYHTIKKPFFNSPVSLSSYLTNHPVSNLPITPVPEQGNVVKSTSGSSTSSLGGLIIRGGDGDWISIRSNFYNSIYPIYDGHWHIDVGTTPAYWENVVLPGSYTIKISRGMALADVYYCSTVHVVAGKTTVVEANSACPFCNVTCSI